MHAYNVWIAQESIHLPLIESDCNCGHLCVCLFCVAWWAHRSSLVVLIYGWVHFSHRLRPPSVDRWERYKLSEIRTWRAFCVCCHCWHSTCAIGSSLTNDVCVYVIYYWHLSRAHWHRWRRVVKYSYSFSRKQTTNNRTNKQTKNRKKNEQTHIEEFIHREQYGKTESRKETNQMKKKTIRKKKQFIHFIGAVILSFAHRITDCFWSELHFALAWFYPDYLCNVSDFMWRHTQCTLYIARFAVNLSCTPCASEK